MFSPLDLLNEVQKGQPIMFVWGNVTVENTREMPVPTLKSLAWVRVINLYLDDSFPIEQKTLIVRLMRNDATSRVCFFYTKRFSQVVARWPAIDSPATILDIIETGERRIVGCEVCLTRMSMMVRTVDEYREWSRSYIESLQCCINYLTCMKDELTMGARFSLASIMCRMKSLNVSLSYNISRVGGGLRGVGARASTLRWETVESAFSNRISTGIVINIEHIDPRKFLQHAKRMITGRVTEFLNAHSLLKVNVRLEAEFVLRDEVSVKSFGTRNVVLFRTSNLRRWYLKDVVPPILASMEEFQERDSGWALSKILHLIVSCNKYQPLQAGCCVIVPRNIQLKRAIVNVISNDEACFFWAIVAGLYPVEKNTSRLSSYPRYQTVLRTEGYTLPMPFKDIRKFERENDISVNVFEWVDKRCVTLHLTEKKRMRHVNLLFLQNEAKTRGHYVCIRNLPRLVSSQLSKHKCMKYICDRCLQYFYTLEKLNVHTIDCERMNDCALSLPVSEEDKWLQFKNYVHKEQAPFVIYADLECLLEKQEGQGRGARSLYQHHHAFSIGYYMHCRYDSSLCEYRACRKEEGCAAWFAAKLHDISNKLQPIFDKTVPMDELTERQELNFQTATHCHVCEQPFSSSDTKVHDHCHFTGAYRGPAHIACNLGYQSSYVIPVVFHNLSGYDAHFIIKELANTFEGKIAVLPLTKERYISFTKVVANKDEKRNYAKLLKFRFIDSFKFLNSSLDKLSSYLGKNKLRVVRNQFDHLNVDDFNLLTRKGVFPYDYLASYDKLNDTCLPSREAFYNQLCDRGISDADYVHASTVWSRFAIKTLGQYSDLYLKLDVLLLADVFENFRDDCLENYKLDPAHYYTLPGFAWDVMLKMTKIELELFTDVDMLLFVERGIRGGLSQCSQRYACANNKYLPKYDSSKPSTYLMYFDVNNLYGWAMSQPLPYRDFRWVEDIENFNVESVPIDSPVGYILEVDLEYPSEIHDAHADLPFCPSHDTAADSSRQRKLMATLRDKERYVLHYRCTVFSEDFVAIQLNKLLLKFHKPIYIGMSVLDISKTHLYSFHYEYMYPNFQQNCKILYTDTDSLIYEIACDDVYETMKRDIHRYDTSNYVENNAYGVPIANKKMLGLMKDENGGKIMTEFVGLRAKMYATRVRDDDDTCRETKKIKGIRTNATARDISFEDYVECLHNHTEKSINNKRIMSVQHRVYSIAEMKLALSPYDDKRYICDNLVTTLPWGHYNIVSLP
ncbi:uncharacterized protein LOC143219338 [Lasioglossum baleicum]|uniref:uncharacterized protein LOC143219338 n=1 Tax=Lasioglossum baleicum TaxID=434251 RepID=UPI003FCC91FB